MGDGSLIELTRDELRRELEDGAEQGARRGQVPPLGEDELAHLLDIFASRSRFTAVDIGDEVVLSYDGTGTLQAAKVDGLYQYEQMLGADSCELFHPDYSYKAVKPVASSEAQLMQEAQNRLTIPVQYDAQADLGRYSQPDGPVPNWSQLLPEGRIEEARVSKEEAVEHVEADMLHIATALWEAGADGINFDTTAAAGDAEFLAVLHTVRKLRERFPDMSIELGMASEFVLGMHGELEFDGVRLAGLWPKDQCKLASAAGATIFGPAVNIRTAKSCAWNTAYSLTVIKPCMDAARIPVHPNVGQGVCGVPVHGYPGDDASSRAAKAHVEILRCDGL